MKKENFVIGITGGSGSGKTTLLKLIREQGGKIMDCDVIYHQLLNSNSDMMARIYSQFHPAFEDGKLDLKKLGAIVFSDPKELADLNCITHGAVKREVLRRLERKPRLAAIDAIALFEGKLAELCDVTVAITAPEEDRVRRLMARDGISEGYARSRIAAQHDDDWFRAQCDHVLENDGTLEAFQAKCVDFLRSLDIM